MKHCPYCPCTFESQEDLYAHMKEFGNDKEAHCEMFRRVHANLNHGFESEA